MRVAFSWGAQVADSAPWHGPLYLLASVLTPIGSPQPHHNHHAVCSLVVEELSSRLAFPSLLLCSLDAIHKSQAALGSTASLLGLTETVFSQHPSEGAERRRLVDCLSVACRLRIGLALVTPEDGELKPFGESCQTLPLQLLQNPVSLVCMLQFHLFA